MDRDNAPQPDRLQTRLDLLALGATAAIAQAVLLREAMAALGGSELAWGSVLAAWLAGMALGSRLGVTLNAGVLVRAIVPSLLVLAGAGTILIRAAPMLLGVASGEVLSTWSALAVWSAGVLPTACAGGLAFPLLAHRLGAARAGSAYALESAGALAGGALFTFVLASLGSAATLVLSLGGVITAIWWRRLRWPFVSLVAIGCLLLAQPASRGLARLSWHWSGRPGVLESWIETRHQRLERTEGSPIHLYTDGQLLATYPDPYVTVPRAHLAMLLVSQARQVLACGCLADGSITTLLRHPITKLVIAEEDPQLLRLLPPWLGPEIEAAIDDPRVVPHAGDPLRALAGASNLDLILLLDQDPTSIRRARTRSVEFFNACHDTLAPGGALVLRVGVPDTYLGGAGGDYLATMISTLMASFNHVAAIPGEEILLVATDSRDRLSLDPAVLAQRWTARSVVDEGFVPEMLTLMLDSSRLKDLQQFVDGVVAPPSTRRHPRVVVWAAALREARGLPQLLASARWVAHLRATSIAGVIALLAASVALACAWRRGVASRLTAAVVGFASMSWWLLLLCTWQASLGSVYAEVGLLTSLLMGGIALGALLVCRSSNPEHILPAALAGGGGLSALLAADLPSVLPALLVPLSLLLAGLLTGAAFVGVAEMAAPTQTRRGAGLAFAADEAGAAVAAAVVGLILIPVAGLTTTAILLTTVMLAPLPGVLRHRQRGR